MVKAAPDPLADGSSPPDETTVAVVGAGPAGATTALHLADRGHDVLLLDRHAFPRDKACGDGLIPDTLNACRRAGVYDEVVRRGRAVEVADIYSPQRHSFPVRGEFVVLKRESFDHLLVEAAVHRGARFRKGRVSRLRPAEDGVRIELARDGGFVRACYAVAATGADVSLLQGLGAVREKAPSAVALRQYVRSDHRIDRLIVSYDRSIVPGYAWIFPTGEGEYNVGCGVSYRRPDAREVDLRSALQRFLREFPEARALMEAASEEGPVRGARLRCGLGGVDVLASRRVLPVGETLATTFPFTGEGIGKAMETGEAAAEVLDEALTGAGPGALKGYAARVEALRPMYLGYELAERWLARPLLNDLIARRAGRSRYMQHQLSGIISETVDPSRVFSATGLLRSLIN